MAILDCESISSTYSSIKEITGINKRQIHKIFENVNFDKIYNENPSLKEPEDVLLYLVLKEIKTINNVDFVMWFHATRVFDIKYFNKGILPLNNIIDSIWDSLYYLIKNSFTKDKWNKFRSDFINNKINTNGAFQYNFKIKDRFHWGPYGFLIKELIFHPKELGNWDYLGSPEIIYDICVTFHELFNIDLFDIYLKKTKAVIVKFKHEKFKIKYLGIALLYIYYEFKKIGINSNLIYCFSNSGKIIPSENIIKIENTDNWEPKL